ncbi:MAG TPA: hypothetical protein VK841_15155, partial [Polyangiaceae bacterium]|nr:hypothetical protein [Polyangiaceae bacterium]
AFSDLVMDANNLYWVDLIDGAAVVRKEPLAGGTVASVGVALGSYTEFGANTEPIGIAVDDTDAYVNLGPVIKVNLATGAATTFSASSVQQPGAIAVNATDVYWFTDYQLAVHAK